MPEWYNDGDISDEIKRESKRGPSLSQNKIEVKCLTFDF